MNRAEGMQFTVSLEKSGKVKARIVYLCSTFQPIFLFTFLQRPEGARGRIKIVQVQWVSKRAGYQVVYQFYSVPFVKQVLAA